MKKFSHLMDPNHPEALDFKELADYKWFKVVNFQWKGQDHYRIKARGNGGIAAITVRRDGKFVMVRQNRPLFHNPLLEFVNAGAEDNESAEDTLHREVFDETGYRVHSVDPIGKFSANVSMSIFHIYLYWVVLENEPEDLPQDKDLPDSELVILTKEELVAAIRSGEVDHDTASDLFYAAFMRRDPLLKELADIDI